MKKTIIALVLLLGSSMAFGQTNTDVLNAYLDVKNDLVQSDSKQAENHIAALQTAVTASRVSNKKALLKAVQKISKTSDLDKQRKGFETVSTLLWTDIKKDTTIGQSLYYQYCPMKKAYWISDEAAVKNPYYGSSMLTCGNTVEQTK